MKTKGSNLSTMALFPLSLMEYITADNLLATRYAVSRGGFVLVMYYYVCLGSDVLELFNTQRVALCLVLKASMSLNCAVFTCASL